MNLLRAVLIGACALFLSGCFGNIQIETPEADTVLSTASNDTEILITYQGIDTTALQINLNGTDVTASFAVTDTQATATVASVESHLIDGRNTLAVVNPEEVSRDFYWDVLGPVMHISSYDQSTHQVQGYIDDLSAISSFTINGAEVALDESKAFTYSFDANSLSSATFAATDALGFSSSVNYRVSDVLEIARTGEALFTDIGARVNASGVDFVEGEILSLIQGIDLQSVLLAANPLVYESKDLKECVWGVCVNLGTVWVRVNAEWLSVGNIGLNITPRNNSSIVDANVSVDRISIGLDPDAHTPGIDYGLFDVTVTMDNITADAALNITPASDGGVNANLQSININLDVDLGALEDALNTVDTVLDVIGLGGLTNTVKNAINGVVEDQLESQLSSLLPPQLEEFAQLIPTSASFDLLGKSLNVAGKAQSFSGNNGGLTATIGAAVTAASPEHYAFGNHYNGASMPSLNFTSTPSGSGFHIAAMVSSDTMNRVLMAAYEAGMTHVAETVYEGTEISEILGEAISGDDQIKLNVVPATPAWVDLLNGSDLAAVSIHDLAVDVSLKKSSDADFSPLLSAVVHVNAPLAIGVGNSSDLQVSIESLPTVDVDNLNVLGLSLSEKVGEDLVGWLVPQVLPSLVESLSSIPLPAIEGYQISPVQLWYANAGYMGLAGNLSSGVGAASVAASIEEATSAQSFFGGSSQYASGDHIRFNLDTEEGAQTRYRLDDGAWSTWQAREGVTLYRVLGGDHTLEVCTRSEELVVGECSQLAFSVGQ